MRLHRFYITENIGDKKEVSIASTELINQIRNVFRLKENDSVIIFDGSGFDYECSIICLTKNEVLLKVNKKEASRYMPTRDIFLCVGIVKKDTFEWIVEKATELGVTHIIPIMAERSEKKFLNEARLKKIAIEASEQSGRGNVPVIEKIMTIEEVFRGEASRPRLEIMVFHTDGERVLSRPRLEDIEVFIGPEGGWSPNEIEVFHKNNADIYCLGKQVLRSETAVIAALSQVVFNN
ncbi:MAG: RsmE family RNA methyltransferase [Candidatus Paceibacterota bacterium]|jgi:16S rRNA (uracil1498-N3)-methyltransferase